MKTAVARCVREDLESERLDEVSANMARIESLAEKLSVLVEDVLSIARADTSHGPSQVFRVDQCIRAAVEKHAPLANGTGVKIDLTAVPALEAEFERSRFESVMDNLISNAVRYADLEKPDRLVAIAAEFVNGSLAVTVRDNGIGIPENMRQRVFGMFERASERLGGRRQWGGPRVGRPPSGALGR